MVYSETDAVATRWYGTHLGNGSVELGNGICLHSLAATMFQKFYPFHSWDCVDKRFLFGPDQMSSSYFPDNCVLLFLDTGQQLSFCAASSNLTGDD